MKIFSCCCKKKRKDSEIKGSLLSQDSRKETLVVRTDPDNGEYNTNPETVYDKNIVLEDEENYEYLLPERYIRSDEKGKITFTKPGLIKWIDELRKDSKHAKWIELCSKEGLFIQYKNGSMLTDKFILGRVYYTMPKSLFKREIDFEMIVKMSYEPEIRLKYDTSIKAYRILEKKDNYTIFKTLLHSPFFFISERDMVDKRVEFTQDGIYYNFASSVDDYEAIDKNAVRMKTYINLLVLTQDEKNFYFECYQQYDAKTILPEKLLNFTIPYKTQEWYKNFVVEINKALDASNGN